MGVSYGSLGFLCDHGGGGHSNFCKAYAVALRASKGLCEKPPPIKWG